MHLATNHLSIPRRTATHADYASVFVSLELSRSKWLVTSSSPASEKISKHFVTGGDGPALLELLSSLRT